MRLYLHPAVRWDMSCHAFYDPRRRACPKAAASRRDNGDGLTADERRALQAALEDGDAAIAMDKQQQALHAYEQAAARQKRARYHLLSQSQQKHTAHPPCTQQQDAAATS